jgi:sialate O-acetylesterase
MKFQPVIHSIRLLACACLLLGNAGANVSPHALFCDHAVLQQERPIPVWGTADVGEPVSVSLGDHKVETKTGSDGRWRVELPEMKAGGPHTLVIEGHNRQEIQDVWIGEVWICSGQSNMERQLGPRSGQQPLVNWEQEAASANYPQIRQFAVARTPSDTPLTDTNGSWDVCSPQTVPNFTAVGYYFGRDLHRHLKVPIGLIHTSWGGTPAEAWTSKEALAAGFPKILAVHEQALSKYPAALEKFRAEEPARLQAWEEAAKQAAAEGKPAPPKPQPPRDPATGRQNWPSNLYQGMVAPLIPYGMRGVIWYQGESNAGRATQYRTLFPAMIGDWRNQWGQGDFPFLFVQIAPHRGMNPEIRDAQLHTWKTTANTAMVVTTDVGDANDIHPTRKEPVGARLALAARALAYGETLDYSGPVFDAMTVEGSKALLSFKHLGGGLVAKDGPLRGFEISSDGKKFVPAKAEIIGDKVVVSAEGIAVPSAVRYAWSNIPDVNLFNRTGLPASPFKTVRNAITPLDPS